MPDSHTAQDLRDVLDGVVGAQKNAVIFAVDRDFRYLAFNDKHRAVAKQVWGADVRLGQNMLTEVISAADRAKAHAQFERAFAGEEFVHVDYYGDEDRQRNIWENIVSPISSATGEVIGVAVVASDVTERERAREALERYRQDLTTRNQQLAERAAENAELIERLRLAVDELSTPVLELSDSIVALPIIGVIDSQRSAQMVERLLTEVVRLRSRFVIVDVTGVNGLDTNTASHLVKMARAVGLLGAECVLTGIQPTVAQMLVTVGVELSTFATAPNIKRGLELCMARLKARAAERTNVASGPRP